MSFRRHSENETADTSLRFVCRFLFQSTILTKCLSSPTQLEMDYQHLYAYLETRPIDELKECMNNVVSLTRKHVAPANQLFATEDNIILNANNVLKELHQLRVAQRIWAQEAISGKFGSIGMGECLTKPEVISYQAHVNGIIDERINTIPEDAHNNEPTKLVYVPISPHVSSADTGLEEICDVVKKQARESISFSTTPSDTPSTFEDSPALGKRKREIGTTKEASCKKSEDWTEAEVQKLFRLVSQHTTPPVWMKNQQRLSEERIDWVKISQEIGRGVTACRSKWITHRQRTMKGGPFTPAEDALIRQREAEWGDKGKGLWVSLEKEMNRSEGALAKRWTALSARVA